jgi:phenylalanyl-tRNA synthetase beta chain
MEVLTMISTFDRKYEGIAKFPASTRDLSMVMDKSLFVGQIEHVIAKNAGKILESCELFDVYEGEQVGEGKKSVAFSLIFRAKDRNLESAEVDKAVEKVLSALKDLGIELRS